jgi:hypothetical protein
MVTASVVFGLVTNKPQNSSDMAMRYQCPLSKSVLGSIVHDRGSLKSMEVSYKLAWKLAEHSCINVEDRPSPFNLVFYFFPPDETYMRTHPTSLQIDTPTP